MPRSLRIRSDSSLSWIEFRSPRQQHDDEACYTFVFAAQFETFSGTISASTYYVGTPAEAFIEAAASWRSWKGPQRWSALEDELSISIEGNVLGGRGIDIVMNGPRQTLKGGISLDIETLDLAADRLRNFFDLTRDFATEVIPE